MEDEYELYGLTLSASGGFGTLPRAFDTANPGDEEFGDLDLGAPNEECSPSGPGEGSGGVPGAEGENCKELGNVLIIQEKNANVLIPDDNADGGMIVFDWDDTPAVVVDEMALLDIDYETKITILYVTPGGNMSQKVIDVPLLGDNSYQVVKIETANVKQIVVTATRSLGIASISFCYEPPTTPTSSPVEVGPPALPTVDMRYVWMMHVVVALPSCENLF